MISTLLILCIFICGVYFFIQLIINLIKRKKKQIIQFGILFISSIVLINLSFFTVRKLVDYNLFGFFIKYGKMIIEYEEWGGIHGDGVVINFYKGNKKDYTKLNDLDDDFFKKYPKQFINNNKFESSQKWKYTPFTENDSKILSFIENAINCIDDKDDLNESKRLFEILKNDNKTLYCYFHDIDDADFWMINSNLAYFIHISIYT